MAVHDLPLENRTLHGPFDRARAPVLEIDPGDTVVFHTVDVSWGGKGQEAGEVVPDLTGHPEYGVGHALCGPVFVRSAKTSDLLEVRIGAIVPGRWGWTWTGPRPHMKRIGSLIDREHTFYWDIDPERGVAVERNGRGITLPIRPFMGVMGNAPAAPGRHGTAPPRRTGGNIDCRELVPGSILWLPVEVDGALFSTGDGHGMQGDGEVGQTGLECPMERVELTFHVRPGGERWRAPRAQTPAGYVTMGFADTLDEAAEIALDEMLSHLSETYGIDRPEAMALASLTVDLHVTQVVNGGTVGVHALLPHGLVQANHVR